MGRDTDEQRHQPHSDRFQLPTPFIPPRQLVYHHESADKPDSQLDKSPFPLYPPPASFSPFTAFISHNGSPSASLGPCKHLQTELLPGAASCFRSGSSLTISIWQPRDDVYGAYDASYLNSSGPKQATQSPVVTGTSVLALKFKDGVVMAADNLGMLLPRIYFLLLSIGQWTTNA